MFSPLYPLIFTYIHLTLSVPLSSLSAATQVAVRSIEHADKHPKKVSAWIANVQDVHRQRPPPTVQVSALFCCTELSGWLTD
jgi:hypothetical protein